MNTKETLDLYKYTKKCKKCHKSYGCDFEKEDHPDICPICTPGERYKKWVKIYKKRLKDGNE